MLTPLYLGLVCNLCPVETINPELKPITPTPGTLSSLVSQQPRNLEQKDLSLNLESVHDGNYIKSLENLELKAIESKIISVATTIDSHQIDLKVEEENT